MSKPESTGGKSLEEILASIRKSLAEEPSARPPEPRIAPAKAAQPQPQPQPKPASPSAAPAKSSGLSSKLAGALNGSASELSDADLSDLLAADTKKPAPVASVGGAKPASVNGGDEKDPLWFLSRLSAATGSPAQEGSAARARDAAKAPAPVEEVKLSRPETLRPSLPPLFDAEVAAPTNTAPTDAKPADPVSSTAKTEPRTAPSQANGATPSQANGATHVAQETTKAEPKAPVSVATPAAAVIPVTTAPAQAKPAVAAWGERKATQSVDPAPAARQSPVAPAEAKAPAELKAPAAEHKPEVAPQGKTAPAEAPLAADAMLGGALQTRALEQTIAGLLEPVIRQWLQANLPRLIEKAVREEVARVTAAERAAKV